LCGGVITRIHLLVDDCGNSNSCTQTITVRDATPPVLVGVPVNTNFQCLASVPPPSAVMAVDNCDPNVIVLLSSVTNGSCPLTITRTWTAIDACTNIASATQTITVRDTVPPVLAGVPTNQNYQCLSAVPPPPVVTATDNCASNPVVTLSVNTNGFAPLIITRSWTARDACTNTASATQIVTVNDTIPPVITCASNRVVECGTGWSFGPPFVTDNCDGTNLVIQILSTTTNSLCGRTFASVRVWRAIDNHTNASQCSQTVTVVDTTPPVIACVAGKTIECGTPWAFDPPSATDICDGTNLTIAIVSTVTNAQCGRTFTAMRMWRATDSCSNASACSQTVTVVDTTPPVITCLAGKTIECGTPWVFDPPSATDICDGTNLTIADISTVTNAQCGRTFTAMRTWRATDSCTNASQCSQTVTVVDTTPPVITCVAGKTIECGTPWAFDPPSATDICDGTNLTITVISTVTNAQCGRTFTATRTWRATDSCSNSAPCSQTVTVVDTTLPVITCVSNRIVECGVVWNFNPPSASDICDGTNLTIIIVNTVTNPLVGQTFSATRTWRAIDSCSNSSACSQTVTIVDTTPPSITCSSNITVECAGPPGTVVPFVTTASDVCDTNVDIVCSPPSGSTFVLGLTTVRCVATDDSGNTNACTFTVRVRDTTPPTIVCPANIIAPEFPHDGGFGVVTFAAPVTGDICDNMLAVGCVPPSGTAFPVGYTTVRCSARDGSGNSNSCTFLVRVIAYRLTVTTTADALAGSLRQALLDANDAPGENLVQFNLPGAAPHRISLLGALPVITSPLILNGASQPGFAGTPVVELDGSGAGRPDGLIVRAGSSTIRALAWQGFATALRLETNGGNVVQGNFIGLTGPATRATASPSAPPRTSSAARPRRSGTSSPTILDRACCSTRRRRSTTPCGGTSSAWPRTG
jgi:hypothetical protein